MSPRWPGGARGLARVSPHMPGASCGARGMHGRGRACTSGHLRSLRNSAQCSASADCPQRSVRNTAGPVRNVRVLRMCAMFVNVQFPALCIAACRIAIEGEQCTTARDSSRVGWQGGSVESALLMIASTTGQLWAFVFISNMHRQCCIIAQFEMPLARVIGRVQS